MGPLRAPHRRHPCRPSRTDRTIHGATERQGTEPHPACADRPLLVGGRRHTGRRHTYGPTLKAANPRIKLLVYENGGYSVPDDPNGMPELGSYTMRLAIAFSPRRIQGTTHDPRSTAPSSRAVQPTSAGPATSRVSVCEIRPGSPPAVFSTRLGQTHCAVGTTWAARARRPYDGRPVHRSQLYDHGGPLCRLCARPNPTHPGRECLLERNACFTR